MHTTTQRGSASQGGSLKEFRFRVGEMDCSSCLAKIERHLKSLDGVGAVSGSVISRTLTVALDEMTHLALVANLMSSLGATPHFGRPNFPISPGYHPAGVVVGLVVGSVVGCGGGGGGGDGGGPPAPPPVLTVLSPNGGERWAVQTEAVIRWQVVPGALVDIDLSLDGGATWTAAKSTATLGTSMNTFILGSPTDTWGRTWSPANFADANFRVRVINIASSTSRDFSLDWIAVRVTHSGSSGSTPPSATPTRTPTAAPTAVLPSATATLPLASTATQTSTAIPSPTSTQTPTTVATDTISIQRAEYSAGNSELRVEATGSNASATLSVYVTSTNTLIGTLRNEGGGRYRADFSWSTNPQSITVRSNLGGSASRTVSLK